MRDPDFINFEPRAGFTRREFVMTTLATGFAAAVQPVAAQSQITTDTQGLDAREVKIPVKDGEMPAYVAAPSGKKNLPTVLVVQEIFGVHEHIKDICRRFAKSGYLAVAPELYARQGDVSNLTNMDQIRPIVAKVPDAQVMADLDSAASWAAKNGGDANKLAITGFCWGGRIVWLYAAHNPRLKAGVAWYGRVEGNPTELQPKNPINVVADINAPVLGLYGGADAGIPNDGVDRMRAALKSAGKKSEIHTYPEMPHGFHADYRPSYRKEAAEDGWKRALAWFKQHGVA
ncbi:MAG TPA: dienelactone hydrolase family protein [Usitatibacter sp.]|nr:dienelactone hydrolase family protein [Usitatibacter sp.]